MQADAAPGGDGTQAAPFQTIEQALAVVQPNGFIHVLSGTYPITQQIALNTAGLTVKGTAGAVILLQAPIIPFLCSADDITIDGLVMTSDNRYPVEFINCGRRQSNIKLSDLRA